MRVTTSSLPADGRQSEGRSPAFPGHREGYPGWGAGLPILAGEPEADRLRTRLAARLDLQLPQDRRHVMVDRLHGDDETLGDLRVAEALAPSGPAPRPLGRSGPRGSAWSWAAVRARPPSRRAPAAGARRSLPRDERPSAATSPTPRGAALPRPRRPGRAPPRRDNRGRASDRRRAASHRRSGGRAVPPPRGSPPRCPRAGARRRARRSVHDRSPRTANASASSVMSVMTSRSPSSHAASARATAAGPIRSASPVCSARCHASSSGGHRPGSPRRARTSPSTINEIVRGNVDARGTRMTAAASSAASSQRP